MYLCGTAHWSIAVFYNNEESPDNIEQPHHLTNGVRRKANTASVTENNRLARQDKGENVR